MPRKIEEEKKPLLFRDGVLLILAIAGSAGCFYMARGEGDLATAFGAWAYVLGGIALVIFLSLLTDKSKKRKRPEL